MVAQVSATYRSNTAAVRSRIDAKAKKVLDRTGARVRGFLLQKIQRRPASVHSAPGSYPFAHRQGRQGMKDVRFGVNMRLLAVAIGHVRYPREGTFINRRGRRMTIKPIRKTVAQNTNEGGVSNVVVRWESGHVTRRIARHSRRPFVRLAMPTARSILSDNLSNIRL